MSAEDVSCDAAVQEFLRVMVVPRRLREARAAWHPRAAYPTLDVDLLVIQSRDDERIDVADAQRIIPRILRAELLLVDGLTHRRTARDVAVISVVADFVTT
jgi:hypothetical protein